MSDRRKHEIARRIGEARENRGLTQDDLAFHCGFARTTIARYESGERIPSPRFMRKLAEVLDVPISHLRASDFKEEESVEPVVPAKRKGKIQWQRG